MKLAILAAGALLTSTIMATPALGAVTLLSAVPSPDPADLSPDNLALAQAQCDIAAATADLDGPDAASDAYTGEVVEGTPTLVSGPTEVGTESDRVIDLETREGQGTFTAGHKEILGDPYRNGGSVNMFGMQQAVGGHYSNSSYDFTADFTTTYAHPYTCNINRAVYHPAVHTPAGPVEGYYTNNGTNPSDNEGSCQGLSPVNPHWGEDLGNCIFTKTGDGTPAVDEDAYFDDPAFVANVAGGSYNQVQTDNLSAHESFGSGFDTSETLLIGQVVVCISPSKPGTKLPGAWKNQNGYTGDKCTTAWYNGGATVGVPNLNDGSHNWVTVPVV